MIFLTALSEIASGYIEDPRNEGTETGHCPPFGRDALQVTLRTRGTRGLKPPKIASWLIGSTVVTLRTRGTRGLKHVLCHG